MAWVDIAWYPRVSLFLLTYVRDGRDASPPSLTGFVAKLVVEKDEPVTVVQGNSPIRYDGAIVDSSILASSYMLEIPEA